ncbi:MAG: zinc ribbon domain-containing protein [Candidatus Heimdallarchaeota archaeon]|nr:zinc ribbon domain-containing protein [Candidatus Heimdallarchaeota archaeon]
MSEDIKLQFTDEDIAVTEIVEPSKKISIRTRKVITWSALIIVFLKVIGMFIGPFIQGTSLAAAIALLVLTDLSLIGLATGFYLFFKEENNIYLLYSSILIFFSCIINITGIIIAGLTEANIIIDSDTNTLIINISSIISLVSLLTAFILMKLTLDGFRKEKRNIFKGQLSLPLGYLLHLVVFVMYMIVPRESITYIDADGNLAILAEFKTFDNVAYYIGLAAVVMVVWGFWYLRRAYVILDKLPEGFFEKTEARQAAMAQQKSQQRTQKPAQTMLGLGRQRPIPPAQRTEEEIDYKPTIIPLKDFKGKKMFCVKCGLELEHDAVFCANCGEPNPYIK